MSVITILFGFVVILLGSVNEAVGTVPKKDQVKFYVVKQQGLIATFTNFGARIVSLKFPDKNGKPIDIVLGYDKVEDFKVKNHDKNWQHKGSPTDHLTISFNESITQADKFSFNAIIGRVANRIAHAQFTLNGTRYKLAANEGDTILNGGSKGFGNVLWNVTKRKSTKRFSEIIFTYKSFNGEQGFPGDLSVEVKYVILSQSINTTITARAENKATPVNIGQHLVFNLAGHNSGDILQHDLHINSNTIVELNKNLLPTGKLKAVDGTPYDFLHRQSIGKNSKREPNGYNINYVLPPSTKLAAVAHSNISGITLAFYTTAPTVHFWTAKEVKNVKGKGGVIYHSHAGFALDGQDYPDAVNHPNEFPRDIYSKGQVFTRHNLYTFAIRDWR